MRKSLIRKTLIFSLAFISTLLIIYSQTGMTEEQKGPLPFGPLKIEIKNSQAEEEDDFYKEVELFTDALTFIRSDYVDETKYKELIYGALKGMLRSLDDYSQFLSPEDYQEVKVETEGEFGGLGIQIAIKDGLLTIIAPIDDTPAYKAGLKANDRIVKIEGEITRDITITEAVKKLRGEPGTAVTITVMREGAERLLDFTITRAIIKIKSIRKAKLFEDNVGYIRLSEFQERSPEELEEALLKLEKEGMDSLILDLRNNPGGLLDSAVRVSEKFVPAGKVIVSTRGRMGRQNMVFKSKLKANHRDYPLVVLVSGGSASGSEIVAGAIQDYKTGILLGTTTFGKGSVQTVIPLVDGSALRLTTSKYFTPSGRSIHEEGIKPDVEVEFQEQEFKESSKDESVFEEVKEQDQQEKETLPKPEQINAVKTTLEDFMRDEGFHDNQLVRAVDLIKGIKLYKKQQEL